jgi:hypothetical protein
LPSGVRGIAVLPPLAALELATVGVVPWTMTVTLRVGPPRMVSV